ncbi:MAG TPA: TIGR02186 family protein, partial [Paracoccaceae bacterium]
MIRATLAFLLFAAASAVAATTEQGTPEQIVAGLSQNRVSITANFDGSEILIYGAVKRESPAPDNFPLQVIVTVEGPSKAQIVR